VRVHGGRARVRPARVPQAAPQVHQGGAQWMLPRVQGGEELLRVPGENVQNTGRIQGKMRVLRSNLDRLKH